LSYAYEARDRDNLNMRRKQMNDRLINERKKKKTRDDKVRAKHHKQTINDIKVKEAEDHTSRINRERHNHGF
jgi:hypothetical protein